MAHEPLTGVSQQENSTNESHRPGYEGGESTCQNQQSENQKGIAPQGHVIDELSGKGEQGCTTQGSYKIDAAPGSMVQPELGLESRTEDPDKIGLTKTGCKGR